MRKILLLNLLVVLIIFSSYSQTIPINPSQVQIKTIPEIIYENDSVHFEVIADFFSGSYCYIYSDTINLVDNTMFLSIHYYNTSETVLCQTTDTIALDTILKKGHYQLYFKGTTNNWSANLDTFYFEVLGGVRGVKDGELLSNIELTQIETGLFQIKNEYGNNLNLKVYNVLGEILSEEKIEIGINKIRTPYLHDKGVFIFMIEDKEKGVYKTLKYYIKGYE